MVKFAFVEEIMEKRTVTQIKIYKLLLNNMTSPKIEILDLAAWAFSKEELEQLLEKERVPHYHEDGYSKNFCKGSILEWYNPPFDNPYRIEWVEESVLKDFWVNNTVRHLFIGDPNVFVGL